MTEKRHVGILIFDDVEVLDFAGPFEVFSRTRTEPGVDSRRSNDAAPFHVFLVARSTDTVKATGGMRVLPDHSFADAPHIDVLVVPGGFGTRRLLDDVETLDWIRQVSRQAEKTTSVCTGSLLLARAGLLNGAKATTHWAALELLQSLGDDVDAAGGVRWVDNGSIITSAGVAAGIDMAFHVVETMLGPDVANETARYIDYPRERL